LIYEPNRVLQITALFKDKVFRLAKKVAPVQRKLKMLPRDLSKLWSKTPLANNNVEAL
jgi:hypothetical protein